MNSMLKAVFNISVFILLVGCGAPTPTDYAYLMTHPTALLKNYHQCESHHLSDSVCETVQQAAHDFAALVNARAQDPLGFGRKILKAQMQLAQTPSPAKLQQVDVLLAVVATNSPE